MTIRFTNTSRPIGRRGQYQYYAWTVKMDEPNEVLARVDRVEYRLHPTFPDPIRTVSDRASGFALESVGWGEFTINITVYMRDGTQTDTEYRLRLG